MALRSLDNAEKCMSEPHGWHDPKGTIQRKKRPLKPMMKKLVLLLFVFGVFEALLSQQLKAQNSAQSKGSAQATQGQGKDAPAKDTPTKAAAQDTAANKAEPHEFVIANFHTESGVTLPQAHITYATYGHLNAARDNAVLLPSHYMATFTAYGWLIGQDRALDTSKLFLVATRSEE